MLGISTGGDSISYATDSTGSSLAVALLATLPSMLCCVAPEFCQPPFSELYAPLAYCPPRSASFFLFLFRWRRNAKSASVTAKRRPIPTPRPAAAPVDREEDFELAAEVAVIVVPGATVWVPTTRVRAVAVVFASMEAAVCESTVRDGQNNPIRSRHSPWL